jgi:hypothetical protein
VRFQGLCADGATLALFELVHRGYRVAAFVHDEVLVELPSAADHDAEAGVIAKIMCDSMDAVTGGRVPAKVEYALTQRWSKKATELRDQTGKLLAWKEVSSEALAAGST